MTAVRESLTQSEYKVLTNHFTALLQCFISQIKVLSVCKVGIYT